MRAKVVAIESAAQFTDKQRRITLRFDEADIGFNQIRLREDRLPTSADLHQHAPGFGQLSLDEVIDFGFALPDASPERTQ